MLQRQKAAKKSAPQQPAADDFIDEAPEPPAFSISPPEPPTFIHPPSEPLQPVASQYPAGVPLPGVQDPLSAARVAAFQACLQQRDDDASRQQHRGTVGLPGRENEAPHEAGKQLASAAAAEAGARRGKKWKVKRQVDKVGASYLMPA